VSGDHPPDRREGVILWPRTLFGEEDFTTGKVAQFDGIGDYFVGRLRSIFKGGVAEPPLPLYSRCNIPLYLLCFAAGNPNAPSATKIARHTLRR